MESEAESKEPQGGKKRLFGVLRLVAAAIILLLIAFNLPWDDQLEWTGANGDTASVLGEIDGDWKSERVRFLPNGAPDDPAVWPEEMRAALAAGTAFDVVRRASTEEPGYEWQPSMPTVFRTIERLGLLLGLLLFMAASMFAVTRWWRLLALVGCRTTWFNALRLTYVGLCFNLVMPGLTGGDLVKGVIVAKENPGRRADAVVSVVVDRLIGLTALAILAVVVIFLSGELFAGLRGWLLLLLGVGAVACALYAAKPLRKALGLSWLVDRLPLGDKLREVDRAALLYLKHPVDLALAFALSFANHILVCVATFALGLALGVESAQAGLREFLVLVPVGNMISALPLAPGGWGVGELAYRELFLLVGVPAALGVAVSVTFRLCNQIGLGIVGALFLLLPGVRAEVRDVERGS